MSGVWLHTYVLLWALVGMLLLLVVGMLRQIGELQLKANPTASVLVTDDGLPLAEAAPPFAAKEASGDSTVSFPPQQRKAVVLFISPTCLPCQELVPALNVFWAKERAALAFYIVCSGDRGQVQEFMRLYEVQFPLIYDPTSAITELFQHHRTPYAYLVDEHGIVRIKGIVNDGSMLESLIQLRGTRRDEHAWQLAERSNGSPAGVHVGESSE